MRCRRGGHATVFCGPIQMAGNRGRDGVVFGAISAHFTLPEWRNGRRDGLKIRCPQGRVGSSPSSGTFQSWT